MSKVNDKVTNYNVIQADRRTATTHKLELFMQRYTLIDCVMLISCLFLVILLK